jgi:plasmid stabilization system protein ParE
MNFTVVWLPDAELELTALWMKSSRRSEVTRASAELDRRLATSGSLEGESRPNNMRIAFETPLAIIFRVDEVNRNVVVARVWEFR